MKTNGCVLIVAIVIVSAIGIGPSLVQRPQAERWFIPDALGHEAGEAVDGGRKTVDRGRSTGYLTRAMYGLRENEAKAWGDNNGLTAGIAFSHNLSRIFPPELYATHPEFFPLVHGERLQPPKNSYFWQPDLGREDVAAWAADVANTHFEQHPDAVSFAVGVNDGLIFGESEETLALIQAGTGGVHETHRIHENRGAGVLDPGRSALSAQLSTFGSVRFFRERPDFTDLVYTFTNRVAREVRKTHPDKYVGALAYYWCENAPSFPLEPNVIPFLTADRSQGYDEHFRAEEAALQRRWISAQRASVAGRPGTNRFAQEKNRERSESQTINPNQSPGDRSRSDLGSTPVKNKTVLESIKGKPAGTASLQTAGEKFYAPTQPSTLNSQLSALNSADSALERRIGLYDYLYGGGFLVPRIHTRLIADNLRQARRLGFTDYFAELNPNWGLDGPMAWMVAQLLQDPEQSQEVLLEEFYTRYFRSAAVPMRRFFQQCEYQWMTQPGPAYWLKHYRNESQARLFPTAVCRELRALLDEAGRQARDEITRKRVAFVSEAFGVTERFVAFCEARDALNRETLQGGGRATVDGGLATVDGLTESYHAARAEFVSYTQALTKHEPRAIAPFAWQDYLRHKPPVAATAQSRKLKAESETAVGAPAGKRPTAPARGSASAAQQVEEPSDPVSTSTGPTAAGFVFPSRRVTAFSDFRGLDAGDPETAWRVGGLDYGLPLPAGWQSNVEPVQHQCAELRDGVLRLTGNKETFLYQWLPADAGTEYAARVQVRGRIGPSTSVILALSWLDANYRRLGYRIHRLPEGDWPEWVTLVATEPPPAKAAWIGVGLRVQNQIAPDWVEAKEFRLEKQNR